MARESWHSSLTSDGGDGPSPLELFFDLSFVVAVAAAANALHHELSAGHLDGLLGYAMVFFALWWSWAAYSWFASAYDSGDAAFRVATFVVMVGVLVAAAGVPRAAEHGDFALVVAGYVVMRIALVPMWLRAGREHPDQRRTTRLHAAGITLLAAGWVARTLWLPHGTAGGIAFALLVLGELAIPWIAEPGDRGTPWEATHITERHALFTIIVLGEVLMASTRGISTALDREGATPELAATVAGALVTAFCLWWLYFRRPLDLTLRAGSTYVFAYLHFVVLGSIAAVGGLVEVVVARGEHRAGLDLRTLDLLVAALVAGYLLALSALHALAEERAGGMLLPLGWSALLLAVAAFAPPAHLFLLVTAGVLLAAVLQHHRTDARSAARPATEPRGS